VWAAVVYDNADSGKSLIATPSELFFIGGKRT